MPATRPTKIAAASLNIRPALAAHLQLWPGCSFYSLPLGLRSALLATRSAALATIRSHSPASFVSLYVFLCILHPTAPCSKKHSMSDCVPIFFCALFALLTLFALLHFFRHMEGTSLHVVPLPFFLPKSNVVVWRRLLFIFLFLLSPCRRSIGHRWSQKGCILDYQYKVLRTPYSR